MGQPGPWLLLVLAASVAGDYIWTGTEWKWQDTEDTRDLVIGGGVVEGSGDEGYDEEEDDDYSSPKQSGKLPTLDQQVQAQPKVFIAKGADQGDGYDGIYEEEGEGNNLRYKTCVVLTLLPPEEG